jgi:hypothetical protein
MADREIRPAVQGASIVALGSFNPAIFQPLWLSGNNLIRKEEAEDAEIKIIHRDVTIFSAKWFSLQVTRDRYSVDTEDPTTYQPLRDLVLGTFKILEHTPVRAFGLNRYQHVRMASEEEWNAFGDRYVPKELWRPILDKPGMRALVVEGKRKGSTANQMQVKIEPSRKVHPGVFIHMNEHYDIPDDLSPMDAIAFFLETLQSSWDDFFSYLQQVSDHLLAAYKKAD